MSSAREKPLRVGVFGLLGSGNSGNDGSLEAVLDHLRAAHPEAVVDAMCGGPEVVATRYGIHTTRLNWYRGEYRTASRVGAMAGKALGKLVDVVRTAAWVRRHDAVIVPGMGVLETTLPLRPWGFPYSLFLLCASGRLFGTKVGLVSVGAGPIGDRPTRVLTRWSTRLAAYRSYRDTHSRDAMRSMGVDTSRDGIYTDLVFALPAPPPNGDAGESGPVPSGTAGESGPVCVGVMDFHGNNDERDRSEEIHRRYLEGTTRFVRALVEDGRPVRLLTGDEVDRPVAAAIVDAVGSPLVTVAEAASLSDLMKETACADAVVATRYHNLVCALKAGTPTLALSYSTKSDALMADMGLGEFCHPAREADAERLLERFRELEGRSPELRRTLTERNTAAVRRVERQFADMAAVLFGTGTETPAQQETP
ncbi:polysaccharide pyruvyl transferase family protein [Streptomyces sp. KM77-8]|uniref:Polysaccharide pyruvyl transferase family protein n=1 Tax=Streptomyces haneummycinicus TaxID=3074435 RepID=A0AAT9HF48_9ACTN